MLKHCTGSMMDLPRRVSSEYYEDQNGKIDADTLGENRVSVSLLYFPREEKEVLDNEWMPQSMSISLSSKYSQLRDKQESIPKPGSKFQSIRIYTGCLRLNLEYHTVRIDSFTSARMVINGVLSKFKLKHVDPNLFYLSIQVKLETRTHTLLTLKPDEKITQLIQCNPWRDTRFLMKSKPGGLIRVHAPLLMQDSVYKSIRVSWDTTAQEVIELLLECCNSPLHPENLCLLEVSNDWTRVLDKDEMILPDWDIQKSTSKWKSKLVIETVEAAVSKRSFRVYESQEYFWMKDKTSDMFDICASDASTHGSIESLDSGFSLS